MNAYRHDYEGRLKSIMTEAFIFDGIDIDKSHVPAKRAFTKCAVWDTGAEVTVISPRIVEMLGLTPIAHTQLMGIGGDEEVGVYKIHVGLPNGYLYEDLYVYCSDIDNYDILIGMDLISLSDFFLTNINGNNRFYFQMPAQGTFE